MNWGTGIALTIVIFIAMMISLVAYSFRQELNLVTKNYYEEEIKYQRQIEKIKNTNRLRERPELVYQSTDRILSVKFPQAMRSKSISGQIYLYRPSDSRLDKAFPIAIDEIGNQFVNLSALAKGSWTVKLQWNDLEHDYYDEIKIFIR